MTAKIRLTLLRDHLNSPATHQHLADALHDQAQDTGRWDAEEAARVAVREVLGLVEGWAG